MKIKLRNSKDFFAGLLFFLFGMLFGVVAQNYRAGTASRMGPGFFPSILGGLLTFLGIVLMIRSFRGEGEAIEIGTLRPLLLVLGAMVVFGVLIESFGLVVGTLALVVISCLGSSESRAREVGLLFLVLVVLTWGIFVYGLNLPFKVWPK